MAKNMKFCKSSEIKIKIIVASLLISPINAISENTLKAMQITKANETNVSFTLYKSIIKIKTILNNKSKITLTDLLAIKSLILSSSLILAAMLPTFLFSKYTIGNNNKCVKTCCLILRQFLW